MAERGDEPEMTYTYDGEEYEVCSDYQTKKYTTFMITNAVVLSIIGVNFLIRIAIILLIKWIGYETHSEMAMKITNTVFIALFFNSGILILLTNANLSDVSEFLGAIFSHSYYDYSPKWYSKVGATLVETMLLNAFMPPIFEIFTNLIIWVNQTRDNGYNCCKPKSERIYHTK